ncbi:VOC family protein [Luteolibacter pohnpeiensis]|uniref:VOC family protein n=1 Tax=Luteolibacter pohnpeiensis TaxID=454153 RepID=A0A934VWT9_9BACT|nr:VOC family protein [Luteolibacter pohnpeiensis]MBK1883625.1 VOC family protein [Luteolibacter pohnpeiensis]
MKPNPVGWFEIYVEDMPRAKAFYEAVFDTQLEKLDTPGIELLAFPMEKETSGAPGALVKMEGFSSGRNSVLIYFTCQDCAVEAARAAANGGSIHMEKFSIGPYGFISLVFDSEGNMIGLHSLT